MDTDSLLFEVKTNNYWNEFTSNEYLDLQFLQSLGSVILFLSTSQYSYLPHIEHLK